MIHMSRAWDINSVAGSNVVVAIIDTGVTTVSTSYPFRRQPVYELLAPKGPGPRRPACRYPVLNNMRALS